MAVNNLPKAVSKLRASTRSFRFARQHMPDRAERMFDCRQTAPGRRQPGWRRAAAAVARAGGNRRHPIHQAGSASHLGVAAQPAEPQSTHCVVDLRRSR
jgi:hypothetical protein